MKIKEHIGTMKTFRLYAYFLAVALAVTITSCKDEAKNEAPPEPDQITKDIIRDSVEKTDDVPIQDLIQVESPEPNTAVTSPLKIRGKARGTWFFEGDFPVRLFDSEANELAVAIATAQGEWMTEEWVDFEASMEFEAPDQGNGELVFEKSNPSDMRELDNEFAVPVKF